MPTPTPPTPPELPARRPRRRWWRRIVIGLLVLPVLLGALYLLRQPLFGRIVANQVGNALSESLGVPLRVDRVLGSWVADARVEGISVETGPRSGVLTDFEAKSIVVHFSLWDILRGDVVGGIKGVEAEGLKIALDLTRPSPQPDEDEETSLGEVIDGVPPRFPPLDVHADLLIKAGLGTFRIDGVAITTPGSPVIALDAEHIICPDPAGDLGALHAKLRRDARGLTWESESELAGLQLARVDADREGVVHAEGTVAGATLDVQFGKGRAHATTGPMRAEAVPAWILRLIPIERLQPSAGTLAIDVQVPQFDPLRVELALEGAGIVLPEDEITSLQCSATLENNIVHLATAQLRASSAHIDVHDIVVDPSRPLGVVSLKRAVIEVADLRRFVEDLDRPVRARVQAHSNDARTIHLEALTVTAPGISVEGKGQAVVPDASEEAADLAATTVDLTWSGHAENLVVGDTRIDGRIDLAGRAQGRVEDPDVDVQLSGSRLVVAGTALDVLRARGELCGGIAEIREAHASGPWGDVTLRGQADLAASHATIASLTGHYDKYALALEAPAAFTWGERTALRGLDLRALGGRIQGEATLQPALQAALRFEDLDLAPLAKHVGGRASGALTLAGEEARIEINVPDFNYDGTAGSVQVEAHQDATGIRVTSLLAEAGDALRIKGQGLLPWRVTEDGLEAQPPEQARFTLDVDVKRLADWAPVPVQGVELALEIEGLSLRAKGTAHQVEFSADAPPLTRVPFDVTTDGEQTHAHLSLDEGTRVQARIDATMRAGWRWSEPTVVPATLEDLPVEGHVVLSALDLASLAPWIPQDTMHALTGRAQADLRVAGTLAAPQVTGSLEVPQATATLAGRGDAFPAVPLTVEGLVVALRTGRATLRAAHIRHATAKLDVAGWVDMPAQWDHDWLEQACELTAQVALPDASIALPFVPTLRGLRGALAADVAAQGPLGAPALSGTVEGKRLSIDLAEPDLTIDVPLLTVGLEGERVRLERAQVRTGSMQAELRGWMNLPEAGQPLDEAPLAVALRAHTPDMSLVHRFAPDLAGLRGRASVDLLARGTVRLPTLSGEIVAEGLSYPVEGLPDRIEVPRLRIVPERHRVRLEDTLVRLGNAQVHVGGTVGAPAGYAGDWLEQPLDVRARINVPTLDLLGALDDELRQMRGRVTGQFQASGTLGAPRLGGHVDLADISGRLPGGVSRLDKFGGRITLADRTVTTTGLGGQLGRSPFSISGRATLPDTGEPTLGLRLEGKHLQLLRTNELRMRADVDLGVRGALSALATTGRVTISDFVYAVPMDLLDSGGEASAGSGDAIELLSIEDGPLSRMRFDVAVRADNTIRVRSNTLRGNVSADVHLVGTGVAPALDGHVSFPDMLVKLPFSSLKVDNGEVRFDRNRPGQPRIQAQAHTQMKGYELDVHAAGIYPDIEVKVASSPPLPQHEALLLLSTGATSEQLAQEGLARAALTRLASVFGKRLFAGGVGPEDPDEKGFLDRFEFIQGRRISRSGQETVEAEYEISERFYLRVERDRYDDFNAGAVWRWRFR